MRFLQAGLRQLATVGALLAAAGAAAASGPAHTLRITAPTGGTISSADGRIRCGATCSASYRSGRVVLLRAAAARNAEFEHWTGDCVGTARSCAVALDRNVSIGAGFRGDPTTLSLSVGGPGTVYSEPEGIACGAIGGRCSATFEAGSTVILSPVPNGGATLRAWGSPCAGTRSGCRFRITKATDLQAAFQRSNLADGPSRLTIRLRGRRVESEPSGIACPPTCRAEFAPGTLVTLRGLGELDWQGACVGTTAACTLVADGVRDVVAIERPPTVTGPPPPPPPAARPKYGINVSVSGRGLVIGGRGIRCGRLTGTVFDCSALYHHGEHARLRAVESSRSRFVRWDGFCAGRSKQCELRVNSPKIVIAIFGAR